MTYIEAARKFRKHYNCVGKGGVVVLYDGQAESWVNELRDPDHWRPGCVAIDEAGNTWTAVAGDEQNGASIWMPNDYNAWAVQRPSKIS